jgi:hypothetical protein
VIGMTSRFNVILGRIFGMAVASPYPAGGIALGKKATPLRRVDKEVQVKRGPSLGMPLPPRMNGPFSGKIRYKTK